ncbi:MAG: ring-opening amidohydrolase [Rhodospirillales bacterium]|nr:ring-opening amidohydrolase [Rhodospirillales bacterium]
MSGDIGSAQQCRVDLVAMDHPGDVAAIARLFDRGEVDPASVVAILGKTEGNGCVNDFTRAYAVTVLKSMLAGHLGCTPAEAGDRVSLIMSGGTEGGISPHFLVFSAGPASCPSDGSPSLAIGTAFTREIRPEEIGSLAQVEATAAAVREAMGKASLSDPEAVHFVQVKCPLLTNARVADAQARGFTVATKDTYASMGLSRGASSLGIALALSEIDAESLSEADICRNYALWSGRASASAGIELMRSEIVVMGNSPRWAGEMVIGHAVMRDAIDFLAVKSALRSVGIEGGDQISGVERGRIHAVLAKAEASRSGLIRGNRHIMSDDSDINATRHARAMVGGVVAAAIGRTDLFVSGGAEHQGPDGGGPIAIIATKRP